jgi:hypothetical protein
VDNLSPDDPAHPGHQALITGTCSY